MKSIEIIVNGESQTVQDGLNMPELLEHFGLDSRKVAIERNLEIVPRHLYDTTRIETGDRFEIVQFVGGG